MATKVVGTRQLRDELATLVDEVGGLEQIIITQRGEGKAVMLDLERYNQLTERLEFLEDSLDAVEAEREGAVPIEDVV